MDHTGYLRTAVLARLQYGLTWWQRLVQTVQYAYHQTTDYLSRSSLSTQQAFKGALPGLNPTQQATQREQAVATSSLTKFTLQLTQGRQLFSQLNAKGSETRIRAGLENRQRINRAVKRAWSPVQKFGSKYALRARHIYEVAFDAEPTQISNLTVSQLNPTSAVIEWDTNHLTRGTKVNYGPSTSYGEEAFNDELAYHHRVELPNLNPATTYYFEVMNQNGGYVFDAYYTLTTPSAEDGSIIEPLSPQEVVVTAPEGVVVYKEPLPDSPVLTTLPTITRLRALRQQDGWISVLLDTGTEGWILNEGIELQQQEGSTSQTRDGNE